MNSERTRVLTLYIILKFVNKGKTPLILSTVSIVDTRERFTAYVIQVYAPAEHKADTVHDTLEQGEELEDAGKDEPPSWAQDLHKTP